MTTAQSIDGRQLASWKLFTGQKIMKMDAIYLLLLFTNLAHSLPWSEFEVGKNLRQEVTRNYYD